MTEELGTVTPFLTAIVYIYFVWQKETKRLSFFLIAGVDLPINFIVKEETRRLSLFFSFKCLVTTILRLDSDLKMALVW